MPVPPVVSLVTLGVADVAASSSFYEALGFRRSSASVPGEVSFFHTAGGILAVWGRAELAADSGVAEAGAGAGSVSLAVNVGSRAAVDAALADALAAGARITRTAVATEWGGYNGYFADPDGHLWEVAHNPHWPLDDAGLPQLP
ncbi:MAG TPA: VOC family protein [Jatrophihabitantaceae bacterium]|nr:VOC family protein [Jatrophihabitantaceae bacterium]